MRPRVVPPVSWHAYAFVFTAAWSIALVAMTYWQNLHTPPPPSNRPLAVPDGGYVSSNACRSCHPANYASWQVSFHRTMTQPARPENVIPSLNGVELPFGDAVYRIDREGEHFLVRRRRVAAPTANAESPREIALLTGSHHQQNFWLSTGIGRTLEPFPFSWLVAEKKWVPVGDSFLAPPEVAQTRGAAGAWNNGCLHCHTTHGQPRGQHDQAFDSRAAEFGISCESCHGEGSEHIARNRNPVTRYAAHLSTKSDPTIVNPGKLSGPASALVCGQCHSIWAFASIESEMATNSSGGRFRPGQPSLTDRFVAQSAGNDHAEQKRKLRETNPHFFEDSYWSDGMVRVTGREYNGVELSPCFRGGHFSCLSCHEMHPAKTDPATLQTWAVSQMRSEAASNSACVQCHTQIGANLRQHTHHVPESSGSRCYDCHMPHTSFGLLRAVRSHQISSPSSEESIRFGRPNACALCHLDRPLAWSAEKLHAWYGQPEPALDSDDRTVAAGAKWLLKGDAGQRGLIAWSMGWPPAQQASGRDWLAPYLAITLNDPYAAVRYVAWKSLQTLPGFEDFAFNHTADDATTFAAASQAYQRATDLRRKQPVRYTPATLLDTAGRFDPATYQRLLDQRDNRRIYIVE